jgi:hypothetical protein
MSQPIWITPAGSLGNIPEGVFYQNTLLTTAAELPNTPTCTATTAGTNRITCDSTAGLYPNLNVTFTGTVFGGIDSAVRYFVLDVISDTEFRITTTESSSTPVVLTTHSGTMTAVFKQHVYYSLIAGNLPPGIQVADNGLIVGVPQSLASLQGVPFDVNRDVTSKFTIRAYTQTATGTVDRIRDRTFEITVININAPVFTSPSNLGTYYDGDRLNIQIAISNVGPTTPAVVTLVGGALPGGVYLSPTGLIYGYIQPVAVVGRLPGYDLTPNDLYQYDFVTAAINKNYQFTLQVTDGNTTDLKTFSFYVYDRTTLNASTTQITADSSTITVDEGPERRPFIVNSLPSDLGTIRSDNYYAHQFIANDYDTPSLKYAVSVNQGSGLPPGLAIDPNSGWYYGYIPDQGVTEVKYSFNVVTYQSDYVGTPITCTATEFGTNIVTCNSTSQIGPGQPIVFVGTGFGGITSGVTHVYYVLSVVSTTEFTITQNLGTTSAVVLTTATGTLTANLIVASDPYPFTLIISGTVNAGVTWLTPTDLGSIENGGTSLLAIEAVNSGGRALKYRLKPGASSVSLPYPYVPGVYNLLPQGLELLPSGEISGRVTFNTFAVDLGTTTFDATQAVVRSVGIQETTFDSTFTFTVNAYAEDTTQVLYKVSTITVTNGGSGYSALNPPVLTFNTPVGASAIQATTGAVTISNGAITAVVVDNNGAGYTSPAILTVTQGFGGAGAAFTCVMKATGTRDVVSVDKTFTIKVKRSYNKPYQNLLIEAMPPANDRALIASLLDNQEIFVPDYIYRIDDPYFGKSQRVTYEHAFGLAPDVLETYVSSLYENHYWKNLVLGEISTAQAIDPVTGKVVYEVVYSRIVDDLVNSSGTSVSKIVNLPYPITDPVDSSKELVQVYPNSLVNMRDQVIDIVGQISTKLPLWMTSKQKNGRVLGFTPAWVMCYAKPGRSQQIAYYVQTQFAGHLNTVDFKVDRYVLDRTLSRNWDTATQTWTPAPNLTTFDRYGSGQLPFVGYVDVATRLAYTDINQRTVDHILELGGVDGLLGDLDGNTIIFVKQEYYSNYTTSADAWQNYTTLYGGGLYDQGNATDPSAPPPANTNYPVQAFDNSYTIPNGYTYNCTNTYAGTNYIKAATTAGMYANNPVWFTGSVFGGVDATGANGLTQIYYVTDIAHTTCTNTSAGTDLITCADTTYLNTNDVVWFSGTTFGGVHALNGSNDIQQYHVTKISSTTFKISLTQGGPFVVLSTATGTMTVNSSYFSVSKTQGGAKITLTNKSGSMVVNFGNTRMAVYTIHVDYASTLVTLTPTQLTAETQYVQIVRGTQYSGQQLYYPTSPAPGYNVVAWTGVPASSSTETTFDGKSMAFEAPVDMYNPTNRDDKYLVFPKANILV